MEKKKQIGAYSDDEFKRDLIKELRNINSKLAEIKQELYDTRVGTVG